MRLRKDYLEEQLKDDNFRREYEKLSPQYDIAHRLLSYREETGMTQKELAKLIGIKRSELSKLESAMSILSDETNNKVINTLGNGSN